MILDIVTFVLFVLALFKGLRRGLIVALFSFVAFFIGIAAAIKLSAVVAGYLGSSFSISGKWLPFIAFILVFLIVAILVRLGARLLDRAAGAIMLGWLNRLGGVLFYFLIYLFVYSILLFYGTQLHIIKAGTISASKTYGFIEPLGPKMINAAGALIPFLRNMFDQLLQFFQRFSAK